jgi:hypothetical protein
MAEVALSALQCQCLNRRPGDRVTMEREVAAWTAVRNTTRATFDWRFTTDDARVRLTRLYPATQS